MLSPLGGLPGACYLKRMELRGPVQLSLRRSPKEKNSEIPPLLFLFVYIYMCVCVCVCTHIYVYIYIYIYFKVVVRHIYILKVVVRPIRH